jgi:hypothetical protein
MQPKLGDLVPGERSRLNRDPLWQLACECAEFGRTDDSKCVRSNDGDPNTAGCEYARGRESYSESNFAPGDPDKHVAGWAVRNCTKPNES